MNMPNMSLKKVEMPVQDPDGPPQRILRRSRWAIRRSMARGGSGALPALPHTSRV